MGRFFFKLKTGFFRAKYFLYSTLFLILGLDLMDERGSLYASFTLWAFIAHITSPFIRTTQQISLGILVTDIPVTWLGKWEVRNFDTVSPTNVPASTTCEYFHELLMMWTYTYVEIDSFLGNSPWRHRKRVCISIKHSCP